MATITLDDVVVQQKKTNEGIVQLDNRFVEFFKILRADRLDMLEQMREQRNQQIPTPKEEGSPSSESATPAPEKIGGSFGGLLAAFTGIITAQALGFAAGIADSIKKIGKIIFKPFNRFIAAIDDVFGKRGTTKFLKQDTIKTLGKLRVPLQKFAAFIADVEKFFRSIKLPKLPNVGLGGFIDKVKASFDSIKAIFANSEAFQKFVNVFKNVFGKVFSFFRVVGKIFLPLTAIIEVGLSLFREFSQVMADENAGFLDYVKAGIKGIIKGLGAIITMPIDLLKDGISWILEKLGMESASKWLDSFSFTDMMGSVVDFLTDLGVKIAKLPVAIGTAGVAAVSAALNPFSSESAGEAFSNQFKKIWNGGESQSRFNTESGGSDIGKSSSASLKTESVAQATADTVGQQTSVTVNNITDASSKTSNNNVSNTISDSMPSAVNSGNSRPDAYS